MEFLPVMIALHLLAVETLAGMLLFLHVVVGPARLVVVEGALDPGAGPEAWCRRVAWGCLAVMAVTMLGWLAGTAAVVSDSGHAMVFDPAVLTTLLRHTQFGLIWVLRLGVEVVLVLILWLRPSGRGLAEDALPWAGLLLLTIAMTGHAAAEDGSHHSFLLTAMVVHLAATAAWVGSLPLLIRLLADAEAGALSGNAAAVSLAREVVQRYAGYGGAAVALLLVSGGAAAWSFLGGRSPDLSSDYAHTLAVKAVLVASMLAVAGWNRLFLGRKLLGLGHPARILALLKRAALSEYALACAIILMAVILSQAPPPAH
ncbi:MAG TPA: CopD family protein [Patescibacteria group bacterium]|nr:CopD family protein [Patescibacteria group bacterium]